MIDPIFGELFDPDHRLAAHLQRVHGVRHAYRRIPLDPLPGQPIRLFLTTGGNLPFDAACCAFTTDGSDPHQASATRLELEPVSTQWDTLSWGMVRTWSVCLPPQPAKTLIRYRLAAHRADTAEWIEADEGFGYALWVDDDPPPSWAFQARVYQIFPDRFYPGDGGSWRAARSISDFYGGTLRGIIDKLDYIQSLGFNTIWITPFFKTTTHHGYNASDYYTVEPRLGTHDDVRELIRQAHARGIRLILDFVANHWSKDHPTFQDALHNPNSPYRDWYFWKRWPQEYVCYFNVRELPKINLHHPAARAYMLEVARYWLQEGFDGYRLDFAYGPPHDFWVDFRRACREVNPECWIFGEVVHTPDWMLSYAGIMDGTLDFHLARALRETFGAGRMTLTEFEAFLTAYEAFFPSDYLRPSFLDNHDEERFLYLAGNDKARLRLAALIQYTLSGPPIVYAGTETGLSQERPTFQNGRAVFEECRLPMNWETADTSLQDYYRRLNHLRAVHPVLWHGVRRLVHLDASAGTYAFLRYHETDSTLTAINLSTNPQTLSLPNPGWESAVDALNAHPLSLEQERLVLHLPPQSGALLISQAKTIS